MSNQDMNLNSVLAPEEHAAVWNAAIVAHFETQWTELRSIVTELNERPEFVTPEHVRLVKDAIKGLMEWLRAHGIDAHFEVTEANGLGDVQAGNRL